MAGNNDYIIPFGIDYKEVTNGISNIDSAVDSMAANSKEANAEMQKAFNSSATASDNLNKSLAADVKTTAQLRDEAKQMGGALKDALNNGANATEAQKKLENFSTLMSKLQGQAKSGIKLEVDATKMQAFQAAIENGANELEVLNQVVAYTKEQLAQLDPDSEAFQELSQQLQTAEGFMEGLGIASDETTTRTKSLKAQLREMKTALIEMELAGQGGTEEFQALSQQAGELEDQIGDVSQRVRVLASDTKYLDAGVQALQGLAGGFVAAQGAAALFGSENEQVTKVIQKVTGAMAVLQGVQALAAALNKDSALSVLLLGRAQGATTVTTTGLAVATTGEAVATEAATVATNSFTAALLANPITAVLVAIAAIVTALILFANSSDDAKESSEELNKTLERQNEILNMNEKALARQTAFNVALAKSQGKTEAEITKIQKDGLAQRLAAQKAAQDKFLTETYYNGALRAKLDDETNKKIEEQNTKYNETIDDLVNESLISQLDYETKVKEERVKNAKEAAQNAKDASAAAKKSAEERKQILEQQIKFTNELHQQETAAIYNQYERERTIAKNAATEKIAELNKETALSTEAAKTRADAIVLINSNLQSQLVDIDEKARKDKAILDYNARQLVVDLEKEGAQKQIDQIALDYEAKKREVEETYKDDAATRVELIGLLNASEIEATKKAKDNLARESLAKDEERAVLEVETATKFLGDLPYIEEQKQIAIMTVKLKYAQLAKQQLLDQGEDENSTAVLNAQKTINDITKGLTDATKDLNKKSGKGIFNLQDIIFGDQGEEGNKAISDALNKAYDSIRQISDFIIDQYQRQIDKKKEVVEQYDNDLDTLQSQLDEEKNLRDAGYANNVDMVQQEINDKKKLRDQEFKQQEELQKKQEAAKKAQMILDTAVQASNLATAATEIFAALAGIPFVGVPLAIAAIGVMVGAFVAAKIKAFQVTSQGNKYEEGGFISGKSHKAGGQKYRSVDGTGSVIELEEGEHVTRKSQSKKYGEILEAINNDELDDISDHALRSLLSDLGIHLESDKKLEVMQTARERDELKSIVMIQQNEPSEELMAIREDVSFMANSKRNETTRWEDEKYYYTRFGNKTTKIPK